MDEERLFNTLGRLEQGLDNMKDYIKSVSQDTKETANKLENHILDDEAHGLKTLNKNKTGMIAWAGMATGLAAVTMEWLRGSHK